MATIAPGTGGTFKTTTAEGRLIETVCFLQLQEAQILRNPSERSAVNGSFDIEDLTFSGQFTLPITQSILPTGGLSVTAVNYLQGVTFAPGSSSPTFVSTSLEAYLIEVISYLQSLESNSATNPNNRNLVTGSLNTDTNVYSGAFNLPISYSLSAAGIPQFAAVEYLS